MPSPLIDLTTEFGRVLRINPSMVASIELRPNDFNDMAGACTLYLNISGESHKVGEENDVASGATSVTSLENRLWTP